MAFVDFVLRFVWDLIFEIWDLISAMPSRFDVVCAGIVVADHLCVPIDHLPEAGELVMTEGLTLEIGGCASNAAVDLDRKSVV